MPTKSLNKNVKIKLKVNTAHILHIYQVHDTIYNNKDVLNMSHTNNISVIFQSKKIISASILFRTKFGHY